MAAFHTHYILFGLFVINLVQVSISTSSYCSGVQEVFAPAGEIASHSDAGSSPYQNNTKCTWRISVPVGKRIVACFTLMDLETYWDKVTLYDPILAKVIETVSAPGSAGFVSPYYVSTSNALTVRFVTDRSGATSGFKLQYEARALSKSSACGSIVYSDASNTSGVLTSPESYDGRTVLHSPSMNCSWNIQLADLKFQDIRLLVTLVNMSLAPGDYLGIASLAESGSFRRMVLSGEAKNDFLLVPSSYYFIALRSLSQFQSFGFKLRFYPCKFVKLTSDSGEIVSHSEVGVTPYSNTSSSTWLITAPIGNQVDISLIYCSLNGPTDLLSLYDEKATLTISSINAHECQARKFHSRSNILRVTFRAESSGSGLGFRILYNTTQQAQYCSGRVVLTAESGEIVSHKGAGSVKYLNNMDCTWIIRAPSDQIIVVWFTYVNLHNYPSFRADKVTVYDGDSLYKNSALMVASGPHTPIWVSPKIVSSSNSLAVKFQTDGSKSLDGFRLRYEFRRPLNQSICGSVRYFDASKTSGELTSHQVYDGFTPHPGNLTCLWNLPGSQNYKCAVSITVVNASLAQGDCVNVTASRFVGIGSRFLCMCGWAAVNNVTLPPAFGVKVQYISTGKHKSAGFKLRFSCDINDASTRPSEASTLTSTASTAPITSSPEAEGSTVEPDASTPEPDASTP